MRALPEDLRLLITLLLNALVLASAARFVLRRHIRDWPQVVLDAMLIWYLVQYLSITVPGITAYLNAGTMMFVSCGLSVAMIIAPVSRSRPAEPVATIIAGDRRIVLGCLGVMLALVAAHIHNQRLAPPNANDALTYHLPAAAQWLQTGRLGLFETWFFNPANTYSPLAGSTFIAWLIAPMNSDILARGVETPALVMIFFVLLQLARALGASVRVAAIIALAGCCSRPLINQVFLAKDDLFVAAFFGAAVVALTKALLQDPLGPLRLGIALGLLLATKYTALMAAPILLLMIDRRHARQYALAIIIALALAGPWYWRNWFVTGNPVFPIDVKLGPLSIFTGLFTPARSEALGSIGGIWKAFTGYSGLPAVPLSVLVVLWITACVRAAGRVKTDPLMRILTLGPPIMIAIFIATSPHAEVRFVYPAFLLMFAASVIAIARLNNQYLQIAGTIVLTAVMIGTSFIPASLALMVEPAIYAFLIIALIVLAIELRSLTLSALIAVGAGLLVYTFWPGYTKQYRGQALDYWAPFYGELADAWRFVRDTTSGGATIAYSNTHFVHPLMGADLDRRIVYAPTRAGVSTIGDLGHVDVPIAGEQIVSRVAELTFRDPDRQAWLDNLRARGAKYLFVAKAKPGGQQPPELEFVRESVEFRQVFDNKAANIYEILPQHR